MHVDGLIERSSTPRNNKGQLPAELCADNGTFEAAAPSPRWSKCRSLLSCASARNLMTCYASTLRMFGALDAAVF